MYGLPKSGVCCACDPNERLSAPSICFVCVFVCRKLSPHLGVWELDHRCLLSLCYFFEWFCILCLRARACSCFHGCPLLLMTWSGSNNIIINITELGTKVGQEKCQAILGLHIFTGCDSISAFKGKGKTKPLGFNSGIWGFLFGIYSPWMWLGSPWWHSSWCRKVCVHSVWAEIFCWC